MRAKLCGLSLKKSIDDLENKNKIIKRPPVIQGVVVYFEALRFSLALFSSMRRRTSSRVIDGLRSSFTHSLITGAAATRVINNVSQPIPQPRTVAQVLMLYSSFFSTSVIFSLRFLSTASIFSLRLVSTAVIFSLRLVSTHVIFSLRDVIFSLRFVSTAVNL